MSVDRFMRLEEIADDFRNRGVMVSSGHLRKIAQAQHGGLRSRGGKARFSNALLLSYPRFMKGPGNRWGCFESVLAEYWDALRRKSTASPIPYASR
jgi:hypothetical protein